MCLCSADKFFEAGLPRQSLTVESWPQHVGLFKKKKKIDL